MTIHFRDNPIKCLTPQMRAKSHYTIEPALRGGWMLTVNPVGEMPVVKFVESRAEANCERLDLDGVTRFIRSG